MTIDIAIIAYKDYHLISKQIDHWGSYIKGKWRLVLADNTPLNERRQTNLIQLSINESFDGISCGLATDQIIKEHCTSDIICLLHPDFFFFDPDILFKIEEQFKAGYKCIGPSGYYPDFLNNIDPYYPEQRHDIAPCPWGMFVDRKLAESETFVVNPPGLGTLCGGNLRLKIVKENIPHITWPGYYPFPDDDQISFFGPEDKPIGCHLLKGSGGRINQMPAALERAMEYGLSKWQ